MDLKNYEFNTHGVELGQFYASSAVISDGTPRPEPRRDPELYYQPSTVPGSHLPHAWVGDSQQTLAMMDIAPYDSFTLITGITGAPWDRAARDVSQDLGVPIRSVVLGPGRPVNALDYAWSHLSDRKSVVQGKGGSER